MDVALLLNTEKIPATRAEMWDADEIPQVFKWRRFIHLHFLKTNYMRTKHQPEIVIRSVEMFSLSI